MRKVADLDSGFADGDVDRNGEEDDSPTPGIGNDELKI